MQQPDRLYIYAPINRPGVFPDGGHTSETLEGFEAFDMGYGFVSYEKALTFDDLYNYQLAPVSHHAWPHKVGDTVLVDEVDTAIVIGYQPRHCYAVYFKGLAHHTVVSWRVVEAINTAPNVKLALSEDEGLALIRIGGMQPLHEKAVNHDAAEALHSMGLMTIIWNDHYQLTHTGRYIYEQYIKGGKRG